MTLKIKKTGQVGSIQLYDRCRIDKCDGYVKFRFNETS